MTIAILGAGPSGLFMLKKLIDSELRDLEIDVYERTDHAGCGMPYSDLGAGEEHVTNVSANEIPELPESIPAWLEKVSDRTLNHFHVSRETFSSYRVLPRLLFGQYLSAQFTNLQKQAQQKSIPVRVHYRSEIIDLIDYPEKGKVSVIMSDNDVKVFDKVVICTGHQWPKKFEGKVKGYFDSPYPPSKLEFRTNYSVAIRGSSLTAIDAVRTLARQNGVFRSTPGGALQYHKDPQSEAFRIRLHTRSGMLPALRIHFDNPYSGGTTLLTPEEIEIQRNANDGFLPLDFVFEKFFKNNLYRQDPELYKVIRNMTMEEFVEKMMQQRNALDSFQLLRAELKESLKSVKRHQPIPWKELLASLSIVINYPAKYFSAEDMLRLQKTLLPLISVVIAFIPQSSCKELLALYDAEVLDIVEVSSESQVLPSNNNGVRYYYGDDRHEDFQLFVDCIGQPHLGYKEFPFKHLKESGSVSQAFLSFRSPGEGENFMTKYPDRVEKQGEKYYLKVSGLAINDSFQVLDKFGQYNNRIHLMSVPYMAGLNPDYSGLDFCDEASDRIIKCLIEQAGAD